ncbi:hypothetical protein FLN47_16240 [Bacillus subtilis]|uniref:hypothetical protein n=1 Tax=Bacillus subtilis TaxID=1423 RepID=UPI000B52E0ED|nr:hypothetical protein [Bacillus subtilis]NJF07325.1 hypothetical protein [Bacillus subtilis]OWV37731.1 hypothetical protein CE489_09710 [Bacillus spizizenii]
MKKQNRFEESEVFHVKQSVEVVEIKGKPVEVIVTELNEPNYEKMARAILKMTRNMKVNQEESA